MTPAESNQAIEELLIRATPEKIALCNIILKRTVKSLRKKLARARIQFNRIISETRDTPEWFYETEIETLSDDELLKNAQYSFQDLTGRSNGGVTGL